MTIGCFVVWFHLTVQCLLYGNYMVLALFLLKNCCAGEEIAAVSNQWTFLILMLEEQALRS